MAAPKGSVWPPWGGVNCDIPVSEVPAWRFFQCWVTYWDPQSVDHLVNRYTVMKNLFGSPSWQNTASSCTPRTPIVLKKGALQNPRLHTHTLAQKHLLQLLYGLPLAADRDMFSAGLVVSGAILGPIPKGGAYAIRSHPGGLGNLHHTSWSKWRVVWLWSAGEPPPLPRPY